ncbi:hypothetical protein PAXINDRAFT_77031 [Paxillus involutus ATCC 200175]|uniref:F-box domain-containing protein n=1 Tax=Paxillus involutus ATCC 200175 TaxID=664439 RepID=A0A0C9U999_PAXIN|nr:hypothetical protein PAXINDRAFT_77031 [Paxillus involutus ATCC 200175]
MYSAEKVPVDLLQPLLDHLDRRDLVSASLVNWSFNRAATPLLYRTLDSHVKDDNALLHPSVTLLRRPELAQYVWYVTETGAVQVLRQIDPRITENITAALRLCTNLVSATYVDDTDTPEANFLPILKVLTTLPLKELVIRTHHDVGEAAWALLNKIKGIRRLSVWSLNWGPPRVLQGWADLLSPTLTHLELGRCAGVPPTILISVFLKLPLLRDIRLKGVPSAAIPAIMACLPNLIALDTEYLGSGNYRVPLTPLPALQRLTVRTGSVDVLGPEQLWTWTRSLLPHMGSLQSFVLNSFAVYGQTTIPWPFIVSLAGKQRGSLREFAVGVAQLTLDSISHLCLNCPALETLICSVASPDVASIAKVICCGKALRTLNLHVLWVEDGVVERFTSEFCVDSSGHSETKVKHFDYSHLTSESRKVHFSKEEAREMMLRPGCKLRAVRLGDFPYTGRWVLASKSDHLSDSRNGMVNGDLTFEVVEDITHSAR